MSEDPLITLKAFCFVSKKTSLFYFKDYYKMVRKLNSLQQYFLKLLYSDGGRTFKQCCCCCCYIEDAEVVVVVVVTLKMLRLLLLHWRC